MNKSNPGKRISKPAGKGRGQESERPTFAKATAGKSGERKSFGSKPPYRKAEYSGPGSERPTFAKATAGKSGERKSYGSKPAYKKADSRAESGERKTYGSKPSYKKAEYSGPGSERPTFAKATAGKSGVRKSYGSKPPYKKAGSRAESGERKTYGSKPPYRKAEGIGHGAERTERPTFAKATAGKRAESGERKTFGSKPPYRKAERTERRAESGERKSYGSKPAFKKADSRGSSFAKATGDTRTADKGYDVKKKAAYGSSKTFVERSANKSITEREEKPARRSFGDKTDTGKGPSFAKKSEMKGYKPRIKEGEEEFKTNTPGARGKYVKTEVAGTFVPKSKSQSKERITENELFAGSEIRLNRYISNAGVSSRREADELIGAGLVTINGDVVTELGTKVKAGDVVKFNGQKLAVEAKVYILLNKPKDAITTSDDPDGRNTVMDLFEGKMKERIFPIGRLDRNTTGVLILTNDGEFANRLTHPKYEINKVYKATLNKNLKSTDLWTLANGVMLEDGMIKPDAIAQSDAKEKNIVGIEIHSGRNRIIHRMFEHLGYSVDKLDRVLYAGLEKGSLKRGEWRELSDKELKAMKRLVHLR